MWLIIGISVVVAAVIAMLIWPSPPNVNDPTKLERTFSVAEQAKLETTSISSDQLSNATCEDGAACWILVDDVVYDLSVFPAWARGQHHGVKAGTDGTDKFLKSSHAVAILQKMPVVGHFAG
ncbi:cytochrome b5 domain-containing protein [Corynebacterium sp. H128]|uniref:cytochrome b5 domain-containing protein n=1 Tax=Corynebacterium sp. H128 TaxID=3133427 RepID=UPI0030B6292C